MENVAEMKNIYLLVFIIWIPQALYQIAVWTYWLQVKEYRLDRFWVFLKSKDAKQSLGAIRIFLKILVILSAIYFILPFFVTLIILDILLVWDFWKRKIRFPEITARVKNIGITSFCGIIITFILMCYFSFFGLFVGEMMLILTPFIGILWTRPLVKKAKEREIEKAKAVLDKYKPIVIAITGSYGKTTTKDFLAQLLETEYEVLATYKNQNTHFGILRRINNDLKKEHKFLIAEVGAYKKGEIKEIADILKPGAAFITGIEPQHLELFGSLQNLKDAKFELVESLYDGGKAFFNLSNSNITGFIEKTQKLNKNITIYTYALKRKGKFDAYTKIIKVDGNGIVFDVMMDCESRLIKTNIQSVNLIENLTGAILAARVFGVGWDKITDECKNLILPEGTLNIFKTKNGITVIDDSYNASPSGFNAALNYLAEFKGKRKFVITTGVIELGKESDKIHKELGSKIDKIADCLLLRNKDFEKPLKEGMLNKSKLLLITDPGKIIDYLKKNVEKKDIVLIEGKLPLLKNYFKSL